MPQSDPFGSTRGPVRRVEERHDADGSRTVTEYDRVGRVTLWESHGSKRGDISRQTMESMHRGFSGSLEGLRETVEPSTLSVTECEYEYDARRNWIRRVSRTYSQGNEGETHESTSTRLIDYYD